VKFLFDFFPVILFFVAYKFADIFVATGAAIASSVLIMGWTLARRHKVATMQWVSFAIILVFGGATLILRDETFIKWKPSVLYWAMSAAFLSGLVMRANLARAMLGEEISLPDPVWKQLSAVWGVFFFALGALNLWVAFSFPTETWVNFKTFGAMGLIVVFVIAQGFWLARHIPDDPPGTGTPDP